MDGTLDLPGGVRAALPPPALPRPRPPLGIEPLGRRLRDLGDELPECVQQSVPVSVALPVDRDRDPGSEARDVGRDLPGPAEGPDRLEVGGRNAEGGELRARALPGVPLGRTPVRAGDLDEPRGSVLRHVRHETGVGSSGAVAWPVIEGPPPRSRPGLWHVAGLLSARS